MSTPDNPLTPGHVTPAHPDVVSPGTELPVSSPSDLPAHHLVEDPPWTFWDVLRIAGLTLVAIIFCLAIAFAIGSSRAHAPIQIARSAKLIIPAQAIAYLLVLGFMAMVVHHHRTPFWRGVQWHWPDTKWFAFPILGMGLAVVVQILSQYLPMPKTLPIDQYFSDYIGAWMMALFGISIAPLLEELFFRGFLYPVLARRLGLLGGIALTAFLFALIHESQLAHAWAPLLILFVVGVVLTTVRATTRSVAATFLMHVGYNLMLFGRLWFASDHFHSLDKVSTLLAR